MLKTCRQDAGATKIATRLLGLLYIAKLRVCQFFETNAWAGSRQGAP
jgi:hypothetical protein